MSVSDKMTIGEFLFCSMVRMSFCWSLKLTVTISIMLYIIFMVLNLSWTTNMFYEKKCSDLQLGCDPALSKNDRTKYEKAFH